METGKLLTAAGYDVRIFNTINFSKSMHYNPFAYIHSEKDILKLVTVLISNTKGEGKAGEDFWVKAETLLYIALIGYIHYELPPERQNFTTALQGGSIMKGWTNDDRMMIACCNDGTRPVIFKIERIGIPEKDEEETWLQKQNLTNATDNAYTG